LPAALRSVPKNQARRQKTVTFAPETAHFPPKCRFGKQHTGGVRGFFDSGAGSEKWHAICAAARQPGAHSGQRKRRPVAHRRLLQGSTGGVGLAAIGLRVLEATAAKDLIVGFIYVAPKDDYGYNQAHAEAATMLKKMARVKIVEE
jgi:hypothetical protein